jgi:hypothetical protein
MSRDELKLLVKVRRQVGHSLLSWIVDAVELIMRRKCAVRPGSGGVLTDHIGRIITGIEPMDEPRTIDGSTRTYYMHVLGCGRYATTKAYVEDSFDAIVGDGQLGLGWKPKIWRDDKGRRVDHVDEDKGKVIPLIQPRMLTDDEEDELCVILATVSWALKLDYTKSGFELREDGSIETGVKAMALYESDDADRLWQNRHGDSDDFNVKLAILEQARTSRASEDGEDEDQYDGADPWASRDPFEGHTGYAGVLPVAPDDREANKQMPTRFRTGDEVLFARHHGTEVSWDKDDEEFKRGGEIYSLFPKEEQVHLPLNIEKLSAVDGKPIYYRVAGLDPQFGWDGEPWMVEFNDGLRRQIKRKNGRNFSKWERQYFWTGSTVASRRPIGWQSKVVLFQDDRTDLVVGEPDTQVQEELNGMIRGAIKSGNFWGFLSYRKDSPDASVREAARTNVHYCKRCAKGVKKCERKGLKPSVEKVHAFNDKGWAHVCGATGEEYWMVKLVCFIEADLFRPFLPLIPDDVTHLCMSVYGPLVGEYMRHIAPRRTVHDGDLPVASGPKKHKEEKRKVPTSEDTDFVAPTFVPDPRTQWIYRSQRKADLRGRLVGRYGYTYAWGKTRTSVKPPAVHLVRPLP